MKKPLVQTFQKYPFECVQVDDTCHIVGYLGRDHVIDIPSDLNGYKVTEVFLDTFYPNTARVIILHDNETTLHAYSKDVKDETVIYVYGAFKQKHLKHTIVREHLQKTFFNEDFMYAVFDNDDVYVVDWRPQSEPLDDINLRSIFINPNTLGEAWKDITHIEYYTFMYRTEVKHLTIMNNVKVIHKKAFYGLKRLESVQLPESVVEIGDEAFSEMQALIRFTSEADSLSLGKDVFKGNKRTTMYFKDTSIKKRYDFDQLEVYVGFEKAVHHGPVKYALLASKEAVVMDASVRVFKDIVIPEIIESDYQVTAIGTFAFAHKKNIRSIHLPNTITRIGYSTFLESDVENIHLPETITEIPKGMFMGCYRLQSIELPASIQTIQNDVFYQCVNLKDVHINEGLETIGDNAFNNATSLTHIDLPNSLKVIKEMAFSGTSLTSITLPVNVERIDEYAFGFIKTLKSYEGLPDHLEANVCDIFYKTVIEKKLCRGSKRKEENDASY